MAHDGEALSWRRACGQYAQEVSRHELRVATGLRGRCACCGLGPRR
jgi:hypothetical protein